MTNDKLLAVLNTKWKDVSDADKTAFNVHIESTLAKKTFAELSPLEQRAITAYSNRKRAGESNAKRVERRTVWSMSISEKTGCIMFYGLGSQFPVSLHIDQLDTLKAKRAEVDAFVEANRERCVQLKAAARAKTAK